MAWIDPFNCVGFFNAHPTLKSINVCYTILCNVLFFIFVTSFIYAYFQQKKTPKIPIFEIFPRHHLEKRCGNFIVLSFWIISPYGYGHLLQSCINFSKLLLNDIIISKITSKTANSWYKFETTERRKCYVTLHELKEVGQLELGGRPVTGPETARQEQPCQPPHDRVRQQIPLQRSQREPYGSIVRCLHYSVHFSTV